MLFAKLLRLDMEKRLNIRRPYCLQRESTFFEIGKESSHSPDVMDNHPRAVAQAFEVVLEPNHHGRSFVGRPLAAPEPQKAVDGPAADCAPIDHAVQPIRFPLVIQTQSDPVEGLSLLCLKIVYGRGVGPEVIGKDAHMQAVVKDGFAIDAALGEVLLVLVEFEILASRWRPFPLHKAQQPVNARKIAALPPANIAGRTVAGTAIHLQTVFQERIHVLVAHLFR